jgi:hypothetical protein
MKKIGSTVMMMIAMVVSTLSFASCSSDDDNKKDTTIIGTWECTMVTPANEADEDASDFEMNDLFKISSNNEYEISGSFTDNGTWAYDSNTLTLKSAKKNSVETFIVMQLDTDNLVLRTDAAKITFKKKQLK